MTMHSHPVAYYHTAGDHPSQHSADFESAPSQPFFFDLSATHPQDVAPSSSYTYRAQATQVLGTTPTQNHPLPSTPRRCFNCGDPTHSLTACPQPRNEPLIRLSRQLFQAYKSDDEDSGNSSLSSTLNVQDELLRRKELASRFFPGQVSSTLREALFWDSSLESPDSDFMDIERPMPWFVGMEKWGVSTLILQKDVA